METLFDLHDEKIIEPAWFAKFKCKQCDNAVREKAYWAHYYAWYCSHVKSGRTHNGKLKIKANKQACKYFTKIQTNGTN